MSTVAIKNLTIKEMQNYYDRVHGGEIAGKKPIGWIIDSLMAKLEKK